MDIKNMGELTDFKTMPTEQTLYLSAIRYVNGVEWYGGPSDRTEEELIKQLQNWTNFEAVRIYKVILPIKTVDSI